MRKPGVDEYIVEYGNMRLIINKYTGRVVDKEGTHPKQPNAANYDKRPGGWYPKKPSR